LPIRPFFSTNFNKWYDSVKVNSIDQLNVLHSIFGKANRGSSVIFFGSGGVNQSISDFSAYTLGKTILCKMVELLATENPEMKLLVFGPGWIYSKMHNDIYTALTTQTEWKNKTKQLLDSGPSNTEYLKILNQIDKLLELPLTIVSGKNFCTSDDIDNIQDQEDMYKFRRVT
jgi:short-subunit dehydrogenase